VQASSLPRSKTVVCYALSAWAVGTTASGGDKFRVPLVERRKFQDEKDVGLNPVLQAADREQNSFRLLPCPVLIRFNARAERLFLLLCGQLRDQAPRLQAVLVQEPDIEALMTRLERILQELWLREFVWESIDVFAPIYDLMAQQGMLFVRHEEEWRIVVYADREAVDEARKALDRWTNPPDQSDD
jgi:hypothetical protein